MTLKKEDAQPNKKIKRKKKRNIYKRNPKSDSSIPQRTHVPKGGAKPQGIKCRREEL